MRILLIGEYSGLHNSLKEGLLALGHEVTLVSDGDSFKQYPSDFFITPRWFTKGILNIPRQAIFRIFKYDIARLESGIRFYKLLPGLKRYDVVQLINEAPIKTDPVFEKYLLKKLIQQNNKTFLLCCGVDYIVAKYMIDKKPRYSLMNPYFKDKSLLPSYKYIFDYISKGHKKLHDFLYEKVNGILASDMDYYLPLKEQPKFLGLAPNPINIQKLEYIELLENNPIIIFLGINRPSYYRKGTSYFEEALEIIKVKYPQSIEVIVAESIPYNEYINLYNKAHIVLDQVYAYDQGYNALEAMAKGKAVFTGAEKEFMEYYNLTEKVAINALPDVDSLVAELSFLIENPHEIIAIGKRARAFVKKEHNYLIVAKRYFDIWENNLQDYFTNRCFLK